MTKSSRLRVAAIMDTWIVSGPGRQIAALSAALKPEGVDLCVFMFQRTSRPPSPFVAYLERAGVEFKVIPENGPYDFGAVRKLRASLQEWQPDIVQSHHYRPTIIVYLLRRLGFSWPWIGFFHGDTRENLKMRVYNALHDLILPRSDRIVVLSEEHRRKFRSFESKVRLVPNAVLALPMENQAIDIGRYRQAGLPLIGVLARLSYEKGVDIFLHAVAHLKATGRPVVAVIAGEGPEREALGKMAQSLGLSSTVYFPGFVKDVVPLYPQLDAVVLPSREGAEGMPNVILEAIKCDVPVVATAVAAVPELLADPGAGEMVKPNDATALADGIGRALANGRSAEASAARKRTAERFSLDQRVQKHLGIYRELCSRNG
jgi:glycosyltransferase involved in cell wall biosynthesis